MRLFVAVWPSDAALAKIAALARPERAGVRWTARDQWHVTLDFLGDVPDVEEARGAFRGIRCREPVVAYAGPATKLMSAHVLCVPVSGLEALAEEARSALARTSRARRQRVFSGHLTVARSRKSVPARVLREWAGESISARWRVTRVTLVSSSLSPRGACYEVIESLPVPRVS